MPAAASGAARLSGVWPPNATIAGISAIAVGVGRLRLEQAQHALDVERLEVQPRRGVEVGRDRLRVRVDHDRRPARVAQGRRGLDRAVVELDPLPDPDRPAADDQRGGPRDRRRLGRGAGRRVGRVEVRRLRGELGGARVDHRVARPRRGRGRAAPSRTATTGTEARFAMSPSPNPKRFAVASSSAASASRGAPTSRGAHRPDLALERHVPAHLGEEPRRDPGRGLDRRLRHAPAQEREHPPQPRVGRREEALEHDRRRRALREPRRLAGLAALVDPADRRVLVGVAGEHRGEVVERRRPGRRPRRAARRPPARARAAPCCSAAPKVRSIAITSPVAFICAAERCDPRRGTCRTGSAAA